MCRVYSGVCFSPREVYALSLGLLVRRSGMSDGRNDSSTTNLTQKQNGSAMSDGSSNDSSSSNNPAQRWHSALRQRLGGHQSPQSQRLGEYQSPHRRPFFVTSSVAQAASPPDLPELVALGAHGARAVRAIRASSPDASPLIRTSLRAERVEEAKIDKDAARRASSEDAR